jgi:Protein of unknown function (DUF1552)
MFKLNRRTVLRGMLGGTAITVALPLLDCFLNSSGEALADGVALPKTFVSWFEGLGYAPGYWEPKNVGAGYDFGVQLKALTPMRDKINIFTGLKVFLDAHPAGAHVCGPQGCLQGGVSHDELPSLDQIIADTIGTRTRFRSIEVSCDGSQTSFSRRSATAINPGQPSPVALYKDIFGPDFKDPNAADFTPDPAVMARKIVLSAIADKREKLMGMVGASDRARLDEYFTSLRAMENKLQIELEKPAPMQACSIPKSTEFEVQPGMLIDEAREANRLFADLLAHAMSCGQTNVASLNFGGSLSNLRRAGSQQTFHMYTHEEMIDPVLGYQKEVSWFGNQVAEAYLDFIRAFDSIKEGKGSLLDRSVIMYSTDSGYARSHNVENMPMMTAGSGGGAMKTGIHVKMPGDAVTRTGLTIMQALGVPVGSWGIESLKTDKTITEVMA